MRKLLFVSMIMFFIGTIISSCSKSAAPGPVIDWWNFSAINGKWAFGEMSNHSADHPLIDTLIFNESNTYSLITGKDTVDKGAFIVGYGESINGFGKLQAYDSVSLKTDYITQTAVYPSVLYFKQTVLDTLSISTYYKDSAKNKVIAYYIRVK